MNALGLAQLRSKDYRGAWHTWADAARIAPENADILINQILLAASCKDAAEKKEKKSVNKKAVAHRSIPSCGSLFLFYRYCGL